MARTAPAVRLLSQIAYVRSPIMIAAMAWVNVVLAIEVFSKQQEEQARHAAHRNTTG